MAAQEQRQLRAECPGQDGTCVSHTADGKGSLLYVHSDRDPGAWYLFDRAQATIQLLLAARAGIDPARMGERRYIRFKASDGMELDGYLNLPAGVQSPDTLPMVLLPQHAEGRREGEAGVSTGDTEWET